MQKSILLFICIVALASYTIYNIEPQNEASNSNLFEIWKAKMGKKYQMSQNLFRFKIWLKSFNFVTDHNKRFQIGLESFNVQMNHFADLTDQQFAAKYTGYKQQVSNTTKCTGVQVPIKDLPQQVNWIQKGAVTPIKDQGQCGSCWAFSATGSLEGVHYLTKNQLLSFSEQQLVDCSRYVNNGCHGGIMDGAFYYVKDHGITLQSKYPYKGVDQDCTYNPDVQKVWQISDCTDVTPQNEKALMAAIVKHPVSVPVDAAHLPFRLYKSGVFSGYCGHTLGHGILAVGYGKIDRKKYYHVKNSWGLGWGDKGFMLIQRNGDGKGHCGIQIAPKFPIA